jgi:hypothetical protein
VLCEFTSDAAAVVLEAWCHKIRFLLKLVLCYCCWISVFSKQYVGRGCFLYIFIYIY